MTASAAAAWHCFSAEGPPDAVIAGMRMLVGLPRGAQTNLWHLLRVGLEEPETPEHRPLFENYAMRFEANPGHLVGAVRACQFTLREAAARNVELAAFAQDIDKICGANRAATELLGPHYLRVRDLLRQQMLEDTLADHGNVLIGFDWRIDSVNVSNHGELAHVPVVFLNLVYRNGEEKKKLSLQLPPSTAVVARVHGLQPVQGRARRCDARGHQFSRLRAKLRGPEPLLTTRRRPVADAARSYPLRRSTPAREFLHRSAPTRSWPEQRVRRGM